MSATQTVSDNRELETDKLVCVECGHQFRESQLLSANNPFDTRQKISGCPRCKSIESESKVCDEPGCWREVCCGFPSPLGYRQTCGHHEKGGLKASLEQTP